MLQTNVIINLPKPAITVLMPVYNAEAFLAEAIESILNQTFNDFEFIIINDGSTDSTEKIILSYNDPRIRYIKNEENIRLIATLNKGIDLAHGKYIVRMDADDISLPDRIAVQYDFMETHPDVAICGSWFETIGDANKTVKYVGGHQQIMLKMLYQCHLCHPSVIIRRSFINSFSLKFDPDYLHAEDYEFFTRVGHKYHLDNIQKVLLKYRNHETSVSSSNKLLQHQNSLRIKKRLFEKLGVSVREHDLEVFKKISEHNYEKTSDFLSDSKSLLEKMWTANERTHFFELIFLKKSLSQFWFNICYNLSQIGPKSYNTYKLSFLQQEIALGWLGHLKFRIKSLLKR